MSLHDAMTAPVPVRALGTGLLLGSVPVSGGVESLADYLAGGGYATLPSPAGVVSAARSADLRGAGGAGFPTATKLEAVAAGPAPRLAVANGEEGEPASVKDRWLMWHRPHLILDGLRAAAHAVAADRAVCLVSDPVAAVSMRAAYDDVVAARRWDVAAVEFVEVAPTYVAGEETSVVRAIEGGEAKPLPKPPRPYEKGVDGHPTLVSNVESLARLSLATRVGAEAGATLLATLQYDASAVLVEAPATLTLRELLSLHPDPGAAEPVALLLGGFAGGIWDAAVLDLTIGHTTLRSNGALWGCGAIIALPAEECVVDVVLDVAGYFADSSSGQCGACVRGTQVVLELLGKVARGQASPEERERLATRAASLVGRGNCAMPDADSLLVGTLLRNFADEVERHASGDCATCVDGPRPRPSGTSRLGLAPSAPELSTPELSRTEEGPA